LAAAVADDAAEALYPVADDAVVCAVHVARRRKAVFLGRRQQELAPDLRRLQIPPPQRRTQHAQCQRQKLEKVSAWLDNKKGKLFEQEKRSGAHKRVCKKMGVVMGWAHVLHRMGGPEGTEEAIGTSQTSHTRNTIRQQQKPGMRRRILAGYRNVPKFWALACWARERRGRGMYRTLR